MLSDFFDLHFPGDIGSGASFYMLICHLFFFAHFFNWVVCFLIMVF